MKCSVNLILSVVAMLCFAVSSKADETCPPDGSVGILAYNSNDCQPNLADVNQYGSSVGIKTPIQASDLDSALTNFVVCKLDIKAPFATQALLPCTVRDMGLKQNWIAFQPLTDKNVSNRIVERYMFIRDRVTIPALQQAMDKVVNFGNESPNLVAGSGVIVSNQGHVLTNYHVLKSFHFPEGNRILDDTTYIILKGQKISLKGMNVVYSGTATVDAAIIQIPELAKLNVLPIAIAASPVHVDDQVFAIGYPMIIQDEVLSTGHVLNDANDPNDLFWSNALISNGNSGGPVVNGNGELEGLTRLDNLDNDDGAIPLDTIKSSLKSAGLN